MRAPNSWHPQSLVDTDITPGLVNILELMRTDEALLRRPDIQELLSMDLSAKNIIIFARRIGKAIRIIISLETERGSHEFDEPESIDFITCMAGKHRMRMMAHLNHLIDQGGGTEGMQGTIIDFYEEIRNGSYTD